MIVHGANCQCVMGAGIAKAIREQFPEAYQADLGTPKAARSKLGTFSTATIVRDDVRFDIVNAYTQFHYRGPGVRLDYDALHRAFVAIATRYAGLRIAYPKIGAGLARGDWQRISALIDEALRDQDHTLVEFQPEV